MSSLFTKACRSKLKLRLALDGPAGAGKTYSALRFAFQMAGPSGHVAVIDTEHRSASKYIGLSPDGIPWQFDVCELEHYAPSTYELAIREAATAGYDVLVIDSLSHAWQGVGGALDQVDRSKEKFNFAAWREVTPQHNSMVESILAAPLHLIATMRTKMEYVVEEDDRGKKVPRKIGLKPIQREGLEFEFDVVVDLDESHILRVAKTRCPAIDGQIVSHPTGAWIEPIKRWLEVGVEPPAAMAGFVPATTTSTPVEKKEEKPQAKGLRLGGAKAASLCSATDAAAIKEHARTLGLSTQQVREMLAKHGAAKVADLTVDAAIEILRSLEERVMEKEGKGLFE